MAVPIAGILNQVLGFVTTKWYFILIPLLLIGILLAILNIAKLKKKLMSPQYWDQIKYTFERIKRELKYSQSPIKFIRHFEAKYRVRGHCFVGVIMSKKPEVKQKVTHKYTVKDIRDLEMEAMKNNIKNAKEPDFIAHKYLVQRNNFMGFYYGEKDILIILDKELTQIKSNTIRIDDPRSLIWRKGFLCTQSPEALSIVDEMHERVMSDHHVDSRGQQMKDFSRIRTDFAHEEKMKDKDIELEEKKEKTRRFG